MFKKVMIAEDQDGINQSVYNALSELGISEIAQTQYCDDAFIRIKKAAMDGKPYELLITDLFFEEDHRDQKYASGDVLAMALKKEFPDLKTIVYTVEARFQKVRSIMISGEIDAYACKGRKGLDELRLAIRKVYEGKSYISPDVRAAMGDRSDIEINDYDITIIRQLAGGKSQPEICRYLEQEGITPYSLSSVEKRINKLKDIFRANTPAHLVALAKDMGLV
ncbi:DNA-binding response regulator [Sinomicrobium oceani]|nr:response regulator transcription factor [Sinomicrobium oceani]